MLYGHGIASVYKEDVTASFPSYLQDNQTPAERVDQSPLPSLYVLKQSLAAWSENAHLVSVAFL